MVAERLSSADTEFEAVARRYRSRELCDRDRPVMERRGWQVLSRMTIDRRRREGLLLGIVGYWLLPKRREVDVIYVRPLERPCTGGVERGAEAGG